MLRFILDLVTVVRVFISMDLAFLLGIAIGGALSGYVFGVLLGICFAIFGVPLLLWIQGNALRQGLNPGESTVLAMPLIGPLYERIFARPHTTQPTPH